ncbi:glycine cleavage system protein GcvH [Blastococcus sp. SYSU D00820]
MATPDDRRYTDQHEWALVQGTEGAATVVRVGITDHAQDALGDIVYVQLPEVGTEVGPGAPIGEVESTKSVSDVYAPVAGVVTAVNEALADAPETINADPYGAGWLVEIAVTGDDGDPTAALLDAAAYQALVDTA